MNKVIHTDICVIGAGSGGLSVAAGAVQMGAKVVLIEKGKMGGDCLNTGCVPSKALLAAGHAAENARSASRFGVSTGPVEIDFGRAIDHVHSVISGGLPSFPRGPRHIWFPTGSPPEPFFFFFARR